MIRNAIDPRITKPFPVCMTLADPSEIEDLVRGKMRLEM
jgi:hypothetical protein